jgi:hypothetical protein
MIRFVPLVAAALLALAAPAAASTAPAPSQTAASPGVSIEAVRAWLTSKGGEVSAINRQDGETWISIADGPLTWMIFFYSCQADVCEDVQYAASFANPGVSLAMINDWNRDHRFLKAYFIPAADGRDNTGVVQYDVLTPGGDVEQLTDHTALWLELVGAFGTAVGFFAAPE